MTNRYEPRGWNGLTMRLLKTSLAVAVALFAGIETAAAQDAEHGRLLSERWCTECHAIGTAPGKSRAKPFEAIAARDDISAEMIARFLLLPHATMPSPPLSRQDAQDIAAFIMGMKK